MELGVVMTRQNFGFPVPPLCSSLLCQGNGGQRSTRARGTLSEAKTQRRPHSARERVRYGRGFPLLFRCFCIFLVAGPKTPRRPLRRRKGDRVKSCGGVRGSQLGCGRLWRPFGRVGGGCAPAHLEKELSNDDGPRKDPLAK